MGIESLPSFCSMLLQVTQKQDDIAEEVVQLREMLAPRFTRADPVEASFF